MSLLLLDTQVLENIVDRIDIDDKSNLILIGNTFLSKKLSLLRTNISILSGNIVSVLCNPNDKGAINRNGRKSYKYAWKTCTNMEQSIAILRGMNKRKYNLLPLHYSSVKHASIHGIDPNFLRRLSKLESLYIHFDKFIWNAFLPVLPSTLTALSVVDYDNKNYLSILEALPYTLLSLKLRTSSNHGIYIDYPVFAQELDAYSASLLPLNLETLDGVRFTNEDAILALPKSITKLKLSDYETPLPIPASVTRLKILTCLDDILSIAQFKLQVLSCSCVSGRGIRDIAKLGTLTSLHLRIVDEGDVEPDTLEFPPNLTALRLQGVTDMCCIIPPLVTNLRIDCDNSHSIFETSTNTWSYRGVFVPDYIPKNVAHAKIALGEHTHTSLSILFNALDETVVSLELSSNDEYEILPREFYHFRRCTKLILPQCIIVGSLPPSLVYMNIKRLNKLIKFPSTLEYIDTDHDLTPGQVRSLPNLTNLMCGGSVVLLNLTCISHVKQVVLYAKIEDIDTDEPIRLPPNVKMVVRSLREN